MSTPLLANPTITNPSRNNLTGTVGLILTTAASPSEQAVALGIWRLAGNTNTATHIYLVTVSPFAIVATAVLDMSSGTVEAFKYAAITPVTLLVNTQYSIQREVVNGGDLWYDSNLVVPNALVGVVISDAFFVGAVPPTGVTPGNVGSVSYGPVNMLVAPPPIVTGHRVRERSRTRT